MDKKKHVEEKTIFKLSSCVIGTLILFVTAYFTILTYKNQIVLPQFFSHLINVIGYATVVFSFASLKLPGLRFTAILFMTGFICIMGSFQQMNISILYVIPPYICYFLHNKKKLYFILIVNIFLFNASKILKSYFIWRANPAVYDFKLILFSNIATSIFESAVFLCIAIPIFMVLVRQNNDLTKSIKEKDNATNEILNFCSTATSFHNKYLTVHINGVRDITKVILDALIKDGVYIDPYYYEQIVFSVQFHDIGKIYIDSSILDKNGKLDADEFRLIKEHPQRGLELFSLLPKNVLDENYIATCKNVIYQHHERLDGTGYPNGIKGHEISFEAKIVAVADVVDALLSWRPYKRPLAWEKVVEILEKEKNGLSSECIKVIYREKDKVLEISDNNNKALQTLLGLEEEDVLRV